jgi:hypothetical protein
MASLAIRQIDDAFFDNGRVRAAGQRAARRDELPAADPARSVQVITIAGQRLVEKEKARNSAAEPVARERPRGYLDTRHTVTWLIGVRTVGERR